MTDQESHAPRPRRAGLVSVVFVGAIVAVGAVLADGGYTLAAAVVVGGGILWWLRRGGLARRPPRDVAFHLASLSGSAPFRAVFEASPSIVDGATATRFLWDFGDGTAPAGSDGPVMEHTYYGEGQFEVVLRVNFGPGPDGEARQVVDIRAATRLPAPRRVRARVKGRRVEVTWEPVEGADGYVVFTHDGDARKQADVAHPPLLRRMPDGSGPTTSPWRRWRTAAGAEGRAR